MDVRHRIDWLLIAVIAFLGGVVANIVMPSRRGALGFVGAAVIGVFCGGVSGLTANAFGAHEGYQYLVAAGAGVLGDRLLSAVLVTTSKTTNVSVSGGLNNIGETHVRRDQCNHE